MGFRLWAKPFLGICRRQQSKIDWQTADAVGPAQGQHAKAFDEFACGVIVNPRQKFHRLGSGSVIGAVVKNQNRLPAIIGQAVDNRKYSSGQGQKQFAPVMPGAFQDFISGILAEGLIRVDNDTAIKVLSQKRQGKDGLSQRTNAMAMPFSDATSVKQCTDTKSVKKSVYLAGNADISLSLGGYAGYESFRPFLSDIVVFSSKTTLYQKIGPFNSFPKLFQHISFILQANIRNPKAESLISICYVAFCDYLGLYMVSA